MQFKKYNLIFIIGISLLIHGLLAYQISSLEFKSRDFIKKEIKKPPTLLVLNKPEKILKNIPKKIIDLAKPEKQRLAKKAKFLSQHNVAVKQESVRIKPNPKASMTDESKGTRRKKTNNSKSKKQEKTGKKSTSYKVYEAPVTADSIGKGPDNSWDRFSHDFAVKIRTGEKTWVNAYKHPDAQYITRMRRSIRLRWATRRLSQILKSYFRRYGYQSGSYITGIDLSLKRNGSIHKISIIRKSGVIDLDHEAMKSIRDSASFGTVPKRLLYKGQYLQQRWRFNVIVR